MEDLSGPAVVKRFTVRRLFGYKDLGIHFESAARVIIAENGTGKTTLLNMLHAFLTGRMSGLVPIDFDSIECDLDGGATIVLSKREIQFGTEIDKVLPAQAREIIDESNLDVHEVLQWVTTEFPNMPSSSFVDHPIAEAIYHNSPFDWDGVRQFLNELREQSKTLFSASVQGKLTEINRRLGKTTILYLPTYRRIERVMSKGGGSSPQQYRRAPSRFRTSRRTPIAGVPQIFFGLADVEERLNGIADDIGRRSNQGYRAASAAILDDLLSGRQLGDRNEPLPDIGTLRLFFSRISRATPTYGAPEVPFERLEQLYGSGEISAHSNQLLRYFLERLASVVNETRDIERRLEQFVDVVNVYLRQSTDPKEFHYDPQATTVTVKNTWTDKTIKLNDLSSGEKQVISLFSLLYLDPEPKFVLIDEPELSLSIDWQRLLLPHVARAPSCLQMLSITHSPFIFENELDPYAGSLVSNRVAVG